MAAWLHKKEKSGRVAAERLRATLVCDRAGTSSNHDLLEMIRRDVIAAVGRYIAVDEEETALDIRTSRSTSEGLISEIVANIPIRQARCTGRNRPQEGPRPARPSREIAPPGAVR